METENNKTSDKGRGASELQRWLGPRPMLYRQAIRTSEGKFFEWHYWGIGGDGRFEAPAVLHNGNDTRAESQQFIGIEDMNGERIFEGDIVKFWINDHNYDLMLIVFDHLSFMAVADDEIPVGVPNERNLEVVGNIVENPYMIPWA